MSKLIVETNNLFRVITNINLYQLQARLSTASSTPNVIYQYNDIPSKRKGKFLSAFDLSLAGGANYLHEHCDMRHKQLGPIYREYLGQTEFVFLADTKLIQTVVVNEGQYPHHMVPEAWTYYNTVNQITRGLFFQSGRFWAELRTAFNKAMLAEPRRITRFGSDILQINKQFLESWVADQKKDDYHEFVVEDIKRDLCRWSIESAGFILFGNRMGCLEKGQDSRKSLKARKLVNSVADMFHETAKFQLLPVRLAHKMNLKAWRKFSSATSNMLQLASEYATENIERIRLSKVNQESVTKDLIEQSRLDDQQISRSLVDLIIASADTTSNSLQWMLYLIAKYPEVQDELLVEAEKILDNSINFDNLYEQAPYTKSFMKEVHRLYPTAPFLARTLDKDTILGQYRVPAGKTIVFSLFTTSRSKKYFDNPLEFKPERWLRKTPFHDNKDNVQQNVCPIRSDQRNHAFASLPFGVGSRMCLGRRAAELQMTLFVASFVKTFHSSLVESDVNVGIKLKMILCPDKPIRLVLRQRH